MGQGSKRAFRLAAACLALAAAASGGGVLALDQQKALTQLVLDSWQTEDGLPQSAVHAILQSRDGFLWAGTEAGLVRFDGAGFKVFDTSNTPGLTRTVDTHILKLRQKLEDDPGNPVYILTVYGEGYRFVG